MASKGGELYGSLGRDAGAMPPARSLAPQLPQLWAGSRRMQAPQGGQKLSLDNGKFTPCEGDILVRKTDNR